MERDIPRVFLLSHVHIAPRTASASPTYRPCPTKSRRASHSGRLAVLLSCYLLVTFSNALLGH